jgi:uncharacterized protein (TIGR03437 family)
MWELFSKMRSARLLILLAAAGAMYAQTWDASGNSKLNGTYYFRQVYYVLGDQSGDLSEAVSIYGNISFDGNGNYSITTASNAVIYDSSNGPAAFTAAGTYSIAASGYGFITSPYASGDSIYGLVSASGVFVGSSTENSYGYNDMFIAAPLASPVPTNSSFSGTWTGAVFDMSSGSASGALSLVFTMNPDGSGNLNVATVNGYVGGSTTLTPQTGLTGLKYTFSNGAAVATFPVNGTLMSGQKYFYFSKDGNFMFGGSPFTNPNSPFDMIVAVKTSTSSPTLSGLYYQAGMDNFGGDLDSYFGATNVIAGAAPQSLLVHQRINDYAGSSVYDYTYNSTLALSGNAYTTAAARYIVGSGDPTKGDQVLITSGVGSSLGLSVGLQAPTIAPVGTVFIDPTRVQNSASNAPFTTGIAPGELLTLYGTNLAPSTQVAGIPFPTTGLGGVQVTIDGLPAAIYYVSASQLSAVVPYGITSVAPCYCADIQVNNNGTLSNVVSEYISVTAPGVFTQTENGLGYGDIEHLGIGNTAATPGKVVTDANPAIEGETLATYLTGLGAVSPSITDGAPGPSGTPSQTTNTIAVDFSGVAGTNDFAGLAPTYSGLYQLNMTLPTTGITVGPNYLDIQGPDSYMSYLLIPIQATAPATASVSEPQPELAIPSRFVRRPKAGPSLRNPQVKKAFSQAKTGTNNQ